MSTLALCTTHLTPIEGPSRWQIGSKLRILGEFGRYFLQLFRCTINLGKFNLLPNPIHVNKVLLDFVC